jgi:adenosylcobyric acid synthase
MSASLMFQGVSSGAGKSTLTALLCRHLSLEGFRVAPFKASNLSLNSFVTPDGKEIGMAQAFQAMAAGIEPCAEMNPILLKPSGDGVMQVVLEGRPFADVGRGRPEVPMRLLEEAVDRSYAKLEREYDRIVVEGSGSPAEINLAHRDLANMRTAELARAPVVLVGDIDKGGVFAALYGTYHLLEERHRRLLKGFVINRFRGDASILGPGIEELEGRMGVPCLGVVPMLDIRLPEEDSLSLRGGRGRKRDHEDVRMQWARDLDLMLEQVRQELDLEALVRIMEQGV